jgi:hypothetical protein
VLQSMLIKVPKEFIWTRRCIEKDPTKACSQTRPGSLVAALFWIFGVPGQRV